ncbi:unnamed protein product, partial [Rotaria magnacalcarata]
MYPLDKFRVEKIALALRHTFSSEQSDTDVKMLIKDLSMSYCQSRPLVKSTSISSIQIRHNNHLRTLFTLQCDHRKPMCPSVIENAPVTIFPNSIRINNSNIYSHDSLHCGDHVYLGGDVAVERSIIEKYSSQIIPHDISMLGNAASMNQEALCGNYPQLAAVDRRISTNLIHAFLIIQVDISFGNLNVSIPFQVKDFNEWAWHQFPRLLSCFIYLWTNHRTIIVPCDEHCSQCLIVDGHQKCRRRICAFKDVRVNTKEMTNLVIGCGRTPAASSRSCTLHDIRTTTETSNQS